MRLGSLDRAKEAKEGSGLVERFLKGPFTKDRLTRHLYRGYSRPHSGPVLPAPPWSPWGHIWAATRSHYLFFSLWGHI